MPVINRVYLVVTKLSSATHPSGARFGRFIRSIASRFFTTTAGSILTAGRNDQTRQVTSGKRGWGSETLLRGCGLCSTRQVRQLIHARAECLGQKLNLFRSITTGAKRIANLLVA